MREFAEKLVPVERQIAEEKGAFLLFALFLREDAPDLWDLLVSAPWIEANKGDALRYLVPKLKAVATPDELARLSRIAIIEKDQPALSALQSAFHMEHSVAEVQSSNFFGLQIKHAYIITSRREGT
jgi:hypothetical protein